MGEDLDDDGLEAAVIAAAEAAAGGEVEVLDCDPALADTAAFCAHYGIDLADSANTIVVATKKEPRRFAACVVLATTRLDVNGIVKRRLDGGKCSFLPMDETPERTGMRIGGVTPFALPDDLPIWVDEAVLGRERVIVGGGSRRIKLRLPPAALAKAPNAEVVADLATPVQPPPPSAGT